MKPRHGRNRWPAPPDAMRRCSRVRYIEDWLIGRLDSGADLPQIPVRGLPAGCDSCAMCGLAETGLPDIRVRPDPDRCRAAVRMIEPASKAAGRRMTWCPLYEDRDNPLALLVARCEAVPQP